jgi:DNA polymerase-3 subunit alpha
MKGRIEIPQRRSELEFVIHSIELLQNLKETKAKSIHVRIPSKSLTHAVVMDLNQLILTNEGSCSLHFTVFDPLEEIEVRLPSKSVKVDPSTSLLKALEKMDLEFELR